MTAIQQLVATLLRLPGWKPDRHMAELPPRPEFKPKPHRKRKEIRKQEALKSKILTALERGPSTAAEVARRIGFRAHLVNAKLSRMYKDSLIDRARSRRSEATGRLVLVYALREHA